MFTLPPELPSMWFMSTVLHSIRHADFWGRSLLLIHYSEPDCCFTWRKEGEAGGFVKINFQILALFLCPCTCFTVFVSGHPDIGTSNAKEARHLKSKKRFRNNLAGDSATSCPRIKINNTFSLFLVILYKSFESHWRFLKAHLSLCWHIPWARLLQEWCYNILKLQLIA